MKLAATIALVLVSGCRGDQPSPTGKPHEKADPVTKPWTTVTERYTAPAMSLYRVASDGRALYWVRCDALGSPCSLLRLAHGASQPTVLVSRPGVRAFVVDGPDVFVDVAGEITRMPAAGGAGSVIASGVNASDLAVSGDWLYVGVPDTRNLQGPSPNPAPGRIIRIPKAGGAPTAITEHAAYHMAIDKRRIYFTDDHAILSVPLDGGAVEELARDDRQPPASIAIDDDSVYFAAGGEVRRVSKRGGSVDVLYKAQIILDVQVQGGVVYAARNLAFDRGSVAEKGAIVRITAAGAEARELDDSPQSLAVDGGGVYVVLRALGPAAGSKGDRIVAYPLSSGS